jgi:hypothetical protein
MSTGLPVSFVLVMGGALLFIGFFIGRAITLMSKKKRNKIEDETPVTMTASVPAVEVPAPLADPAKYTELLRLWRGKDNNGLFVETSGHLLASSMPLNPAQKKRFIALIKELAVWLEIPLTDIFPMPEPVSKPVEPYSAPAPVYAAAVPEPINAAPLVKASTPIKTDPIPSTPPPIPATSNPGVQVQSPVPPVSYTPVPPVPVKPPVKPAVEPAKIPATSMVEQIDEILQEIIQRSETPNRLIKIMEERQEGVIVWVGQEHFSGIDAVTDPSAKELIRAAAKEWERRAETRL